MRGNYLPHEVQVSPGGFGLFKVSPYVARGIVLAAQESQPWPSALEPIVGGGIDLQHHPEGFLALPTTAVLAALDFSLGRDALLPEEAPKGFPSYSEPFSFAQDLAEVRVVDVSVLPQRQPYHLLPHGLRHSPRAQLVPVAVKHALRPFFPHLGHNPVHRPETALQ